MNDKIFSVIKNSMDMNTKIITRFQEEAMKINAVNMELAKMTQQNTQSFLGTLTELMNFQGEIVNKMITKTPK